MKQYLALALIVIAGIIPFSSRAVFMDEHIFLRIAENAANDPLFPQDTPTVFFGTQVPNLAAHTHPPVGEYYLALIHRVLGEFSEVPYRLLFSVFSVAAVLAFFFLARRFVEQPFLVSTLFALSPAFFVMSPTLMMDVPMLAFLLLGIAFYFAHLEGRKHALPIAAACWILSVGTGYTALVPLACLFLQIVLGRRPKREWVAVLLGPTAIAVWQLAMTAHFGRFPLIQVVGYFKDQGDIVHNIAATLSFVGAVTLFPWIVLAVSERPSKWVLIAGIVMATVFAVLEAPTSMKIRSWYVFLAGSGFLILSTFIRSARGIIRTGRNTGEAFLILWFPTTLLFFIVVADMINARYVLLALPALLLVLLRHSTVRQLVLALAPTALLSICVAYSDFAFVNAYRDWVRQTVPPLLQQGFRAWGASESGLRFYLEQQGIPTLTSEDVRPSGPDLVVRQQLFRYGLSEDLSVMLTVIKTFPLNLSFPLRTFNRESGSGFHDSRIGIVPFAISQAPLDIVEIAQTSPFVENLLDKGLIGHEDQPAWSPDGVILKQEVDQREFRLKIPADCKLEYELLGGRGTAEINDDRIVLKRQSPGTIVWRNVRMVPLQFLSDGR